MFDSSLDETYLGDETLPNNNEGDKVPPVVKPRQTDSNADVQVVVESLQEQASTQIAEEEATELVPESEEPTQIHVAPETELGADTETTSPEQDENNVNSVENSDKRIPNGTEVLFEKQYDDHTVIREWLVIGFDNGFYRLMDKSVANTDPQSNAKRFRTLSLAKDVLEKANPQLVV